MRIALAQINPTSGDLAANTARILDAIAEARGRGADLVVTPEMCLPGYCIGDLVEDTAFVDANEAAMQRIAAACTGITAVVGFIDHDSAARNDHGLLRKYNAAAVVRDGRVLQRARKSLLPNYRYFDDKRFFSSGESRQSVAIDGTRRRRAHRRVDLRGSLGRVLRGQAAGRAGGERRGDPAQHQRVTLRPGQATDA